MDRPLVILPDYLEERVVRLSNMNVGLFEMEESVRPCSRGSLYHILRCGHKVRTTVPERCGENCRIFWNGSDFACPRCIEKELRAIRAAGDAMEIPEEDIIAEIKFSIDAEVALSRKRVATTVMYRDSIEDFYRDNFPELMLSTSSCVPQRGHSPGIRRSGSDITGPILLMLGTTAVDSLTEELQSFGAAIRDDGDHSQVDEIDDMFGRLEAKGPEQDANISG
ncbi:uncharacterized protein BDZ99DRAFT_543226 [Mytilinidion resinicola]|uniref:Uncharacterized protein n=1 Tax=Mytilinidion resinicola TaxID=574789 RepID=A0A6A6Z8I2_9PEZI|nr:uncharacterized protein BDZ99DRAFT_543226 [Mytilinidion resinicola]KAF2816604.1 hypothetical protein BDZ99DRAFT_543226 [Mytilinidion resinicola]